MRYLLTYTDKDNNLYKIVKDTSAFAIAQIQANLLAYKCKGSVVDVKYFELEEILLKAIKQRSVSNIIKALTEACNGTFTMEQLKGLAEDHLITYEEAMISEEDKYDSEMWYTVNDYIITFSGVYNVYGTLELRNIVVYDYTDSIIMEKDIENNQIKKGA